MWQVERAAAALSQAPCSGVKIIKTMDTWGWQRAVAADHLFIEINCTENEQLFSLVVKRHLASLY
jgi:hypothetical protein